MNDSDPAPVIFSVPDEFQELLLPVKTLISGSLNTSNSNRFMRTGVVTLILFVFIQTTCKTQNPVSASQTVDKFMQEYMQFSRLGQGYSREISQEITDQFKTLFKRDAFLYWDLYKSPTDSLIPPLPVGEYIDRAIRTYHQKQPLLDYSGMKIRVKQDEKDAFVYLKKTNHVLDFGNKALYENKIKLRIDVDLSREKPLIQNIYEDKRFPLIRAISVGINYIPWSNVISSLTKNPVLLIGSDEQYAEFSLTAGILLQIGMMLEMNVNRNIRNGLTFSAGLFYSQLPLSSFMKDYCYSFPDTLDKTSDNPLAFTTYERASGVTEKILIRKIEIPLLFKSYLNNWMYLKAGTTIGYLTASSDVDYVLSRTGLNELHAFPKEKFLQKMTLSIQIAAGFEKQLNYFSFGLEPNISFGLNPLVKRTVPGNYHLNNIYHFNSIILSTKMPAFEFAFGMKLLISYMFKN
ncbi:MAG: hypothetical protein NTW16_18780 [Bacteroidetes bacterium]|nr:hypothetical protein [Bacteroidota bacterium]